MVFRVGDNKRGCYVCARKLDNLNFNKKNCNVETFWDIPDKEKKIINPQS